MKTLRIGEKRHVWVMAAMMLMSLQTVCAATTVPQLSEEPDEFLTRFQTFVTKVVTTDDEKLEGALVTQYTEQFKQFLKDYNETFAALMTTEQITEFNKYRSRYQKKMIKVKAERKGAAVKGWFEGLQKE